MSLHFVLLYTLSSLLECSTCPKSLFLNTWVLAFVIWRVAIVAILSGVYGDRNAGGRDRFRSQSLLRWVAKTFREGWCMFCSFAKMFIE